MTNSTIAYLSVIYIIFGISIVFGGISILFNFFGFEHFNNSYYFLAYTLYFIPWIYFYYRFWILPYKNERKYFSNKNIVIYIFTSTILFQIVALMPQLLSLDLQRNDFFQDLSILLMMFLSIGLHTLMIFRFFSFKDSHLSKIIKYSVAKYEIEEKWYHRLLFIISRMIYWGLIIMAGLGIFGALYEYIDGSEGAATESLIIGFLFGVAAIIYTLALPWVIKAYFYVVYGETDVVISKK